MEIWQPQVDRFCNQYFQLESDLDFPHSTFLQLALVQDAIFTRLFADAAVVYKPPRKYQVKALKALVAQIEQSIEDWDEHGVSDDLMTTLSLLVSSPLPPMAVAAQQKSYVSYYLSRLPVTHDKPYITLLENRYLLGGAGTTGLRTWEAGLHMSEYLCAHPALIEQRRVLELGAGTGYLSILCAKYLDCAHVTATDGSEEVVHNLPENLFLNGLQGSERISVSEVKWGWPLLGTEEEQWNGGRPIDVVIGADITYDASVIPALIATLADLFGLYPDLDVYISAAKRSAATFGTFMEQCRVQGISVEDVHFGTLDKKDQKGPFYDDSVSIRVYKLSKP